MPDPPLDANPVSARLSSLQFYKTLILFFHCLIVELHGLTLAMKETPQGGDH
jgi:hypothetical protein